MQIEKVKASNQTPIALWSVYCSLRPGVDIQLVNASWDPDGGNIKEYRWYIDGVLVSSSSSFTFSKELAEGQNSRTFSIKLQVKDDENTWGTRISSLTISAANRSEYYLTDHLGSIRTTIDDQGNVIGYDDYYPFGQAMPGRSLNSGTPNDLNKFTGHERDQEGGLDLDYMLARNYDPEIGRFLSVDPLASKFPAWSPYNYTMNNPMRFIDPDGKAPDIAFRVNPGAAGGNGHTSMYFQNGEGNWYQYDQGGQASSGDGSVGVISGQSVEGAVRIVPVSEPPSDAIRIKTSQADDVKITNSAFASQEQHNSGQVKYNLYTNNCTDAAVDVVNNSGASINIKNSPTTVKPNTWMQELKDEKKPLTIPNQVSSVKPDNTKVVINQSKYNAVN